MLSSGESLVAFPWTPIHPDARAPKIPKPLTTDKIIDLTINDLLIVAKTAGEGL